jgi:DNA-binding response OmpR family regulator
MCVDDVLDLRCLLSGRHRAPVYEYKVLFVSRNLDLLKFLRERLKTFDCYVDYCPAAWLARSLLEHDIYFTLCLFDDLPDMTGVELATFTRTLANRKTVPIIVIKELIKDEAA